MIEHAAGVGTSGIYPNYVLLDQRETRMSTVQDTQLVRAVRQHISTTASTASTQIAIMRIVETHVIQRL